jgi:hypothetical protein
MKTLIGSEGDVASKPAADAVSFVAAGLPNID